MNENKLLLGDCLEEMKLMDDKSVDIIFTDPPYALGSEVIIRSDGKPNYSKAVDFMGKWKQPDGKFWEEWFIEAMRILKYGGRVIMFGMDRQLMLNKYYACFAGFVEQQSLYWYFSQNFPKSSSLSKNLDKNAGVEREIIGITNNTYDGAIRNPDNHKSPAETSNIGKWGLNKSPHGLPETASTTDLAKKYDGFRYSISPLKQTCETIMVFQKPYKTGSCLHDILAFENGDEECLCGALDIDNNRVGYEETTNAATNPLFRKNNNYKLMCGNDRDGTSFKIKKQPAEMNINDGGRYPAQSFIQCICDNVIIKENKNEPYSYKGKEYNNKETSMFNGDKPQAPSNYNDKGSGQIHTNPDCPCYILDQQSGNRKSGAMKSTHNVGKTGENGYMPNHGIYGKYKARPFQNEVEASEGGCSKILHKCRYDEDDFDIYQYAPKVSRKERNEGLDELSLKEREPRGNNQGVRYCKDCGLTDNGTNNHDNCSGIFEYKICQPIKNNHSTVKPLSLLNKILQLFKTPNKQVVLDAFLGSGSIGIACNKLGFEFIGIELDKDYFEIAKARIEYHQKKLEIEKNNQLSKMEDYI